MNDEPLDFPFLNMNEYKLGCEKEGGPKVDSYDIWRMTRINDHASKDDDMRLSSAYLTYRGLGVIGDAFL